MVYIRILLRPLAKRGQLICMQWVPSHYGLPGGERVNVLAGEPSALPQDSIRIDSGTIQKAVVRAATCIWQRG